MKIFAGFIIVGTLAAVFFACKKEKSEPSAPVVTTVGLAALTDSSVKAGGKIVSAGNEAITATGFCWSTVTTDPGVSDDTSVTGTTSVNFVKELKNLAPSTTYYIRAYAINILGIGYGEVLSFNTTNASPKIDEVVFVGSPVVDSVLTATYIYSDFENDPDSASIFQWYNATDTSGVTDVAIAEANSAAYKVNIADTMKFVRVGVTPFSSAGSSPGRELRSTWIGPIHQ